MNNARPIIGICPDVRADGALGVHRTYFDAVERAGGTLIMLPLISDEELLRSLLNRLHGLILPGGLDVEAKHFGEEHASYANVPNTELDTMHLLAARLAIELELPTLGVCRGMQVLNVARGGTLYQDMAIEGLTEQDHMREGKTFEETHTISLLPAASVLANGPFDDPSRIYVNTSHHQALKRLGEGIVAAAVSPDGVIEAIEMTDRPQIIGVQWHPERISGINRFSAYLFERLVADAGTRARTKP